MAEVLVFLANGSEEMESVSIINILRRGGVEVKTVSITDKNIIIGSREIKIETDIKFENLTSEDFENAKMFVLPGGLKGYEAFKNHKELLELLKKAKENSKYICAICASPSFLGENGLLEGVEAICYPGFETNLKGAIVSDKNVVISKNFVTGKGPAFSIEFSLELLKILKGDKVYKATKDALLLK